MGKPIGKLIFSGLKIEEVNSGSYTVTFSIPVKWENGIPHHVVVATRLRDVFGPTLKKFGHPYGPDKCGTNLLFCDEKTLRIKMLYLDHEFFAHYLKKP